MTVARRAFTMGLLALLLSGCAGSEGPVAPSLESGAPPTGERPTPGDGDYPVVPLPVSESLRWNECAGMRGLFTEPAAAAPVGDEVPPGWEQQPLDQDSSYQLNAYHCNRVSVGPFERPVTVMTELHNKIAVPQQCIDFNPELDALYVLVALWIDDAEIADYLHATFGIPVRVAKFEQTADNGLPVGQRGWSWSTEGSTPSEMGMAFVAGNGSGTEFVKRIVWHNGTAVSMLDNAETSSADNFVYAMGIYGILNEPMLHARMDGEPVVGRGDTWHGDATQTVYRFGDLECKEPL